MKQRFTSKQTSINSTKAPAVGSIQPQKPPGFTVRRSPFMTHSIERRNITPQFSPGRMMWR